MVDRDRGDGEAGERVFLSSREAAENGAESPAGDLEARLRVLLDLLPEVLVEVDMTSRIVFVNRTGLELFGYDLADP